MELKLKFHIRSPYFFFNGVLTAGVTITLPPGAPGIAPLTMMRLRSASMRAMTKFCTVRVTSPRWPSW